MWLSRTALAWALTVGIPSLVLAQGEPPVVDLGTSVHRASFNATSGIYSFSNIPYAEPPLGQRRFRLPKTRTAVNRTVDDGSFTRICPQASGAWQDISVAFMIETIMALDPNNTGGGGGGGGPPLGGPDPRESEDCLLLDVMVPQAVFNIDATPQKGVPVLAWIHGGGFTSGSKSDMDPTGLIAQSTRDGREGVIVVAINYRLGLFGFPPRNPEQTDVVSNAGLYDQRLALKWIQENIGLFGGDPDNVTVMGESAGASSILSLMTARVAGSDSTAPFSKAIIQSPAMRPASDVAMYSQVYQLFLAAANGSSIEAARDFTSAQLRDINTAMVVDSAFGSFTFGPNIDGQMVPDYLGRLLAKRKIDPIVQVIVAKNALEGLLFTDPRVQYQAAFKAYMSALMPSIPSAQIDTLAEEVYPEDFSGAFPYQTQSERLALALSEGLVSCNAFGTNIAYRNATRSYQFSVFPGIHAQDVPYTFFNGEPVDFIGQPIIESVAEAMQRFFVDFAAYGTAGASTAAEIPMYGANATVLDISNSGFAIIADPAANSRCRFWIRGLYSKC